MKLEIFFPLYFASFTVYVSPEKDTVNKKHKQFYLCLIDTMLDARDRNINSIIVKVYTKLAMQVAM